MKTSHEFALELLAGPDLLIGVPKVLEYSDCGSIHDPIVTPYPVEEPEGIPEALVISYREEKP